MVHAGVPLTRDLPNEVHGTYVKLRGHLAALEQPDADDPVSKSFWAQYLPGRTTVVDFLKALDDALKAAFDDLLENGKMYANTEELNLQQANSLQSRVSATRAR